MSAPQITRDVVYRDARWDNGPELRREINSNGDFVFVLTHGTQSYDFSCLQGEEAECLRAYSAMLAAAAQDLENGK